MSFIFLDNHQLFIYLFIYLKVVMLKLHTLHFKFSLYTVEHSACKGKVMGSIVFIHILLHNFSCCLALLVFFFFLNDSFNRVTFPNPLHIPVTECHAVSGRLIRLPHMLLELLGTFLAP